MGVFSALSSSNWPSSHCSSVRVCSVASVVPDSVWPYGLQAPKLICPWDSPGKNRGVGCHFLLQGIFPTQGSNPGLLYCRQILYRWATGEALQFCREIKNIDSWNISVFIFFSCLHCCRASLVAQLVKNLLAMRETWVLSLGWEDPLEKGTATHSSILTWWIPWTIPWGCKELDMTNLAHYIIISLAVSLAHGSQWPPQHLEAWQEPLLGWSSSDSCSVSPPPPNGGDQGCAGHQALRTDTGSYVMLRISRKHGRHTLQRSPVEFLVAESIWMGLPWWSRGQDSALSVQGACVWPPVRELDLTCHKLRVHMLQLKTPHPTNGDQWSCVLKLRPGTIG